MRAKFNPADHWGVASGLLVVGGLGASLAAAFCCALPPLLIAAGVAGSWTLELQSFFGPHQQALLWLAASGLGVSGVLWVLQTWRVCAIGLCPRIARHILILLGLFAGSALSWLAFNPA